jgi:hypothetical protein
VTTRRSYGSSDESVLCAHCVQRLLPRRAAERDFNGERLRVGETVRAKPDAGRVLIVRINDDVRIRVKDQRSDLSYSH